MSGRGYLPVPPKPAIGTPPVQYNSDGDAVLDPRLAEMLGSAGDGSGRPTHVRKEAPWHGKNDGFDDPPHTLLIHVEAQEAQEAWAAARRAENARNEISPSLQPLTPEEAAKARKSVLAANLVATPLRAPASPREALLTEATQLITGDRNKSYGSPTENFQNTADLWNVQFKHLLKDGAKFTAAHIAQAQIQLKMARMVAQPKRDNYLDVAGYAACGWECEEQTQ